MMNATAVNLYSLDYSNARTYLVAMLFVVGNILLPQLFHLIPQGGIIFLPIYFFTLLGAYKYGWKVGLITAILSPLTNSLLFGMPIVAVLPTIMVKSVLLAMFAGFAAAYFKRISLPILLMVVLAYQIIGTLIEWLLTGSFSLAIQDFRIGLPGMILQIVGGFIMIKHLISK
jgi:hypothetical protein